MHHLCDPMRRLTVVVFSLILVMGCGLQRESCPCLPPTLCEAIAEAAVIRVHAVTYPRTGNVTVLSRENASLSFGQVLDPQQRAQLAEVLLNGEEFELPKDAVFTHVYSPRLALTITTEAATHLLLLEPFRTFLELYPDPGPGWGRSCQLSGRASEDLVALLPEGLFKHW